MFRFKPFNSKPVPTRRRLGAVLSMELILILPIVIALVLGMTEISLLWAANHRVQAAAGAGCRVATHPGATMQSVRRAIETSLDKQALVESYQLEVTGGMHSGDEIALSVNVPQAACAPDLLKMFGYSLQGKTMTARSVMRRE